ncbi:MAG: sigma-70 family RNA polymerase sigma factor [Clostridium sp.]|uniref:RNA polymerase sigma factor n=1 Tax=Clostridium sp. TaxID=1506 RepID=UPI002903CEB8|nr:sigma-70 family RNA polymerase sigma factor [Clostridium sp.]MDU1978401.1 sigma-70 family RNA polymerase sigma factor [Clostridium sp.]MDU1994801.1 sigma-70 family RNA polymerase sigma factor [Clostridium sp.]MDU6048460.1 sigma-70 family RNA polymerase sigma factor [Clostridium sp.]MDU6222516.1 sigma-70 family RNA polymerase sigma factor [Clostridium sp.]MDU6272586.1 sigma-70 family RNA polymerase sigma factor [Clostridium sp.]
MDKSELLKHIELFKNGDKSEFEVIYLETNNKLYNYIFSLSDSLNNEDCIELVQETYIQVNNKIDTLKDCRAFYSWMFMIARNKALRYLDKRKKEVLLSEDGQGIFDQQSEIDIDLLPEDLLDSKEKQRMILDIINSLPEEQKEVIYLRYYNGLSVKQIAEELNISDGTVKSRLNYGRKKIQVEVEALEKKGTKLYGLTGLPIILFLLRYVLQGEGISAADSQSILSNVVNSTSAGLGETEVINNSSNINSESSNFFDSGKGLGDKNVVRESLKATGKGVGMKAIAAGVTAVLLIGGGIFVYNNKNDSITSPVIQEENSASGEGVVEDTDNEELRFEVEKYKGHVEELYDLAETGNLVSKDSSETWTIDYFLNEIQLIDNGYSEPYYDSVHPIWSVDSINDISLEVKNVIDAKKEVLELKEFNDKEKEILKECDEMIAYFLSHQEKLDALNDRLKIVANHDGNERAKEAAVEFNQKYEEYKKLLENLR